MTAHSILNSAYPDGDGHKTLAEKLCAEFLAVGDRVLRGNTNERDAGVLAWAALCYAQSVLEGLQTMGIRVEFNLQVVLVPPVVAPTGEPS